MEYNKLVAITGLPGLFELVSSKSEGAIVRSLVDKTTKFASSRLHQFSHLESIEIYTIRENVNLTAVFQAMEASEEPLPAPKDEKAIKAYFQKVYPDMDFDRVYMSDMRKMVKWFDILKNNNIEIKLTEPEATEAETPVADEPVKEDNAVTTEEPQQAAPKKKTAAKKKTTPKAEGEEKAKAPAKKAAAKKKSE